MDQKQIEMTETHGENENKLQKVASVSSAINDINGSPPNTSEMNTLTPFDGITIGELQNTKHMNNENDEDDDDVMYDPNTRVTTPGDSSTDGGENIDDSSGSDANENLYSNDAKNITQGKLTES